MGISGFIFFKFVLLNLKYFTYLNHYGQYLHTNSHPGSFFGSRSGLHHQKIVEE